MRPRRAERPPGLWVGTGPMGAMFMASSPPPLWPFVTSLACDDITYSMSREPVHSGISCLRQENQFLKFTDGIGKYLSCLSWSPIFQHCQQGTSLCMGYGKTICEFTRCQMSFVVSCLFQMPSFQPRSSFLCSPCKTHRVSGLQILQQLLPGLWV